MTGLFGSRIAALCGAAFAVLLMLGVMSLEIPHEATDQEVTAWWSDDGNQNASLLSMGFVAFAAFGFGLFATSVRDLLNATKANSGNAMFALAICFVGSLLASAAARGTLGNGILNGEPVPDPNTLRFFPELAYTLMEVALMGGGACLLLTSAAVLQTRALPSWVAWSGLAAGALTILGVFVVGALVIPVIVLWALAASVAVWRSGGSGEQVALRVAQPA